MQILSVKVDQVSEKEALKKVEEWLSKGSDKHFITTPNLEFIRDAQNDKEFLEILNQSDLALPDSSRLSWLKALSEEPSFYQRILKFLSGIIPSKKELIHFDVVTGVDFMEHLCGRAADLGFTVGLLGGEKGVAERCAELLQKKYQNLKVVFVRSGGNWNEPLSDINIIKTDILFVAFGHKKQEKWIVQNLPKVPVKVAMGVGGAFNYLSGDVKRAPQFLRNLGLEWFFRLLMEPWRIKRIFSLVLFLIGILTKGT